MYVLMACDHRLQSPARLCDWSITSVQRLCGRKQAGSAYSFSMDGSRVESRASTERLGVVKHMLWRVAKRDTARNGAV